MLLRPLVFGLGVPKTRASLHNLPKPAHVGLPLAPRPVLAQVPAPVAGRRLLMRLPRVSKVVAIAPERLVPVEVFCQSPYLLTVFLLFFNS